MAHKAARWYAQEGDTVYIYDAPTPAQSASVSIVSPADLAYYRKNFRLAKVWAD